MTPAAHKRESNGNAALDERTAWPRRLEALMLPNDLGETEGGGV